VVVDLTVDVSDSFALALGRWTAMTEALGTAGCGTRYDTRYLKRSSGGGSNRGGGLGRRGKLRLESDEIHVVGTV